MNQSPMTLLNLATTLQGSFFQKTTPVGCFSASASFRDLVTIDDAVSHESYSFLSPKHLATFSLFAHQGLRSFRLQYRQSFHAGSRIAQLCRSTFGDHPLKYPGFRLLLPFSFSFIKSSWQQR